MWNIKKLLEKTINDLKNNKNACILEQGMKLDDGTIITSESNPGKVLNEFIMNFYKSNLIDT